jgi:hypothetical protein
MADAALTMPTAPALWLSSPVMAFRFQAERYAAHDHIGS